ncbi:kinase-like domain-containing protein [Hyaloraphidium curvatum]|nr:kinase-like domain-containing protein [Hyaloraphidium curvatum]
MEYVAGPNLQSHLDRLGRTMPEDDVRLLVGTILGTLAFLHAKGVVHRDVKPANIVLRDAEDPSSAVLIDFGSACADPATADPEACARRSPAKVAGTPFFLPPEAFAGERCSEKTDIWSLGCLTFQLLTGTTPFADSSSLANLSLRVVASSFSFTDGCRASPAARDFIRFLLHPDPRSRPDAGKALVHPWLCPPALAQVGQGAGAAVVYCAEEGLRVLRMPGAEWDPMVAPPGADPGRVAPGAVVA